MGHIIIKLPDVGEGTAQAELAAWLVKVGDTVSEDQNLAEVTTDKATVEIPAPASGRVKALHGAPGDVIAVGSRLIELETEGAPAAVAAAEPEPPKLAAKPAPTPTPAPAPQEQRKPVASKILASPAVRQRATELGLPLSDIVGSGPGGRIIHRDLDTYIMYQRKGAAPAPAPQARAATPVSDAVDETKIVGIRRKIAERMLESKRNIPHYSYVEEVDVTALEELRTHLNDQKRDDQPKLSVLPFIVTALARAIPDFPTVNAHFDDEMLKQYAAVHAGIATQTDKGLMVPVVFHAEAQSLWELARAIAKAADGARTGRADRKELTGSTITVTSLGKLGGIVTTPVINRPEVAIVGVNKVVQRPVVLNGQVVIRSMMNLSSSFDHRIVDGFVAAAFIQRVKALLEQPALLFIGDQR